MPMQTLRAGLGSKWWFGTGQGSRIGEEGHGWGELGSEGQTLRKAAREPWDLITPQSLWASRAKTQSGRAGLTSSTVAVCSAAFFFLFSCFFSAVFFEGMWPGPHAYQPPELSINPSVSDGVLQRNRANRMCIYRRRFILRHWPSHCGHCVPDESLQACPTVCDPLDCSPLGSSVHGILQARMLERVAMPSSRGSSQPWDRTCISCIGRRVLYH